MLPSEQDTMTAARKILRASRENPATMQHKQRNVHFEHGHWWLLCNHCSASWDVVDTDKGFDFERIDEGDESCHA